MGSSPFSGVNSLRSYTRLPSTGLVIDQWDSALLEAKLPRYIHPESDLASVLFRAQGEPALSHVDMINALAFYFSSNVIKRQSDSDLSNQAEGAYWAFMQGRRSWTKLEATNTIAQFADFNPITPLAFEEIVSLSWVHLPLPMTSESRAIFRANAGSGGQGSVKVPVIYAFASRVTGQVFYVGSTVNGAGYVGKYLRPSGAVTIASMIGKFAMHLNKVEDKSALQVELRVLRLPAHMHTMQHAIEQYWFLQWEPLLNRNKVAGSGQYAFYTEEQKAAHGKLMRVTQGQPVYLYSPDRTQFVGKFYGARQPPIMLNITATNLQTGISRGVPMWEGFYVSVNQPLQGVDSPPLIPDTLAPEATEQFRTLAAEYSSAKSKTSSYCFYVTAEGTGEALIFSKSSQMVKFFEAVNVPSPDLKTSKQRPSETKLPKYQNGLAVLLVNGGHQYLADELYPSATTFHYSTYATLCPDMAARFPLVLSVSLPGNTLLPKWDGVRPLWSGEQKYVRHLNIKQRQAIRAQGVTIHSKDPDV